MSTTSAPAKWPCEAMHNRAQPTVSFEEKLAFLSRPAAYPESTRSVRRIDTHMSVLFVGDAFVYKLKKPVRMPFVDFSTLERRRRATEESFATNRRWTPSIYLAVVALTRDVHGCLQIGGSGAVVEWLEKMRRLPDDLMLDTALARGAVDAVAVRRVTRALAAHYAHAVPEQMAPAAFRRRLLRAVADNESVLGRGTYGFDVGSVAAVAARQRDFVRDQAALLDARLAAGRVIEAHGDLRPEHVVLLEHPVFIDRLEFDRDRRVMDVADELSYLAMECDALGAGFVGRVLFEEFTAVSGDHVPEPLIGFYKSFRALMRCKLAVGHLPDYPQETHPHWLRVAGDYLALADRNLPA